jgi:hypothetical protein
MSRSACRRDDGPTRPDPRKWKLEVDQAAIDLYVTLLDAPRALSTDEAAMMVDLVNAWRAGEHEKHIALMAALAEIQRLTEQP